MGEAYEKIAALDGPRIHTVAYAITNQLLTISAQGPCGINGSESCFQCCFNKAGCFVKRKRSAIDKIWDTLERLCRHRVCFGVIVLQFAKTHKFVYSKYAYVVSSIELTRVRGRMDTMHDRYWMDWKHRSVSGRTVALLAPSHERTSSFNDIIKVSLHLTRCRLL